MYTRHGHHVPGTAKAAFEPLRVARCGGIGHCPDCSLESGRFQRNETDPSMFGMKARPKKSEAIAYQLTEDNADRIAVICGGLVVEEIDVDDPSIRTPGVNVPTLNGIDRLSLGDYLLQDSLNRFRVEKKIDFEAEYDTE